jgi:putative CocE/NonD family hydrolase
LGNETGLTTEAPVSYFKFHEEAWGEGDTWPPKPTTLCLYPNNDGGLGVEPAAGSVSHQTHPETGTGSETRYERIAGLNSRNYYFDWQGRTDEMLSFDSADFTKDTPLAGHAQLDLCASFDAPDAGLFVYLTEVEADGTERYMTEAVLRALFRDEQTAPDNIRINWPFRSFSRESGKPLPIGQVERMRIPFLPTAWTISKGSKLRLSIAGIDKDHFKKVPHGKMPRITVDLARTKLILPLETDGEAG